MDERRRRVKELRAAKKSFPAIAFEMNITEAQARHAARIEGLTVTKSDFEIRIRYLEANLRERKCLTCGGRFMAEHSAAGKQRGRKTDPLDVRALQTFRLAR